MRGGGGGDLSSCYLGNFSFATKRTKEKIIIFLSDTSSIQNVCKNEMDTNICAHNAVTTVTFTFNQQRSEMLY